jgi:hypothetical protein
MRTPDINRILRNDIRHCGRGAPMGDTNRDERDQFPRGVSRVYCQRIRFVDGDYGADGTYWGGGRGTLPLWCVFTWQEGQTPLRAYYRAQDRAAALALFGADV